MRRIQTNPIVIMTSNPPTLRNMRMNKYIAQFAKYLETDDWQFKLEKHQGDGREYLRAGWKGRNTRLDLVLDSREESDLTMCFVYLPVQVPEDRRAAVAELICRLNYRFHVGHLDLDFNDGEVRFRQSIDMEGGELTETMISNMIYTALGTCDDYFAVIMSVAFGGKNAMEALQEPEREAEPEAKETGTLQ